MHGWPYIVTIFCCMICLTVSLHQRYAYGLTASQNGHKINKRAYPNSKPGRIFRSRKILPYSMTLDIPTREPGPYKEKYIMITTPTVVSIQPVSGYMMWQDGQPYGIPNCWSETKRSLLIGYDLMPLRGLEVTEQVMAEKGKIARETLVELATEEDHHCYGALVNGQFVPHML